MTFFGPDKVPRQQSPLASRPSALIKHRWVFAVLGQASAYVWTTAAVTFATATGLLLTHFAPLPNVSMVFLLAVLFAAAGFGLRPALFASVLSFLSYNFF